MKRFPTKYPGVFYRIGERLGGAGEEKIFYIVFKKDGRVHEEKAGRQFAEDMTEAKAARIRADRIENRKCSPKQKREAAEAAKLAEKSKWTIDRLWQEYKSQKIQNRNLQVDDNRYQNHIRAAFGDKEPSELIHLDIDRLRINLLKKRSPQTSKHVLSLLRRIIRFGTKKGLCAPPSFAIEMPSVDNIKTEDLTPEQFERLLILINESDHIQARGIMLLALCTGMRANEMFHLEWADVDFDRGFITIRDPKGGKTQKIPMNDSARKLLENHPRMIRGGEEVAFVFPGKGGKRRKTITKPTVEIRDKAGLPKSFRPLHGLRHVYASMLASSGQVDLFVLQRLLTHKSPQMTQRYAHLRDEALKKAAAVAGDIISNAAANAQSKADNVLNMKDHK